MIAKLDNVEQNLESIAKSSQEHEHRNQDIWDFWRFDKTKCWLKMRWMKMSCN